ncbi:uncharacterized protein F5891DRAFT_985289 [Suillus fuscotomentosus]|uniref:Uncharacterized protein n=1 Tax=Suillus fuscotomentosus TaxID=1912939 RepID=A0AAD4DUM0_9AGAM|nr:uncharacterized protein F5891DRAFT_985289 [Suillus fuscotomentosus]KAG1894175.1 hypothetical protein F5891DRAFT_985289 [Suillus fuscotomentosus]
MNHGNGYISLLCPEIQRIILEHLGLSDLITLAETRNENKEGIKDYIAKRRVKLFRSFVDDVDGLLSMMEDTGSVVSGSSALSLIRPEAEELRARDMDVYVTEAFEEEVLKHLKEKEGYAGAGDVVLKQEYNDSAMAKIFKLEKGEKKVDVIVTHWTAAVVPILQFHMTSVMNYITADSLVCLYPRWTTEKKGFINPRLYLEGKSTLHTVEGLMKYVGRGFKIRADPLQLGEHNCEDNTDNQGGYCPHKLRSTVDDKVMQWNYSPTKTLGETTIVCQTMPVMVWCLGGYECAVGNKDETMSMMFVCA